ncbi:hypothetical protein DFS34DRAFT_629478 [Phlyctochytrium arcticum]|nr:hypothetical protein DFS34DRAFT_629478 [Phlyctochytrium arcticum]
MDGVGSLYITPRAAVLSSLLSAIFLQLIFLHETQHIETLNNNHECFSNGVCISQFLDELQNSAYRLVFQSRAASPPAKGWEPSFTLVWRSLQPIWGSCFAPLMLSGD